MKAHIFSPRFSVTFLTPTHASIWIALSMRKLIQGLFLRTTGAGLHPSGYAFLSQYRSMTAKACDRTIFPPAWLGLHITRRAQKLSSTFWVLADQCLFLSKRLTMTSTRAISAPASFNRGRMRKKLLLACRILAKTCLLSSIALVKAGARTIFATASFYHRRRKTSPFMAGI